MTVLTIAIRELRERAMLLYGSAMIGVMLLSTPWLAGSVSPIESSELRGAAALVLFLIFVLPLAAMTGASVASSDLAEGRLGFYFSRPVPGHAIWLGKIGGAALLLIASVALIMGPSALAGMDSGLFFGDVFVNSLALPTMVLVALVVIVIAHAVGIMRAARSNRLAGDLAVWTLAIALAWSAMLRFRLAPGLFIGTPVLLIAIAVLALLVGGALAIIGGRSDARRGHRLMSYVMWPSLLVAGLGAEAYSRWVVAATPADLREFEMVRAAPQGTWLAIGGESRGRGDYRASFLLDRTTSDQSGIRTPGVDRLAFSADGTKAAWLELDPEAYRGLQETSLLTLDLRRPGAQPVRTKIGFRHANEIALDEHGARIAVASDDKLSIYELASEHLIAVVSTREPESRHYGRPPVTNLVFVGSDRVRAFGAIEIRGVAERSVIADLDLTTRSWTSVRPVPGDDLARPAISRTGERCFLAERSAGGTTVDLVDASSGATLARTAIPNDLRVVRLIGRSAFLADGRSVLAVPGPAHGSWQLEVRDAAGALLAQHQLPFTGASFGVGDEIEPGRLVLSGGPTEDRELRLLDVTTGELSRPIDGLRSVAFWRHWFSSAAETPLPASLGARLFLDRAGSLVELDPKSLAVTNVLAGR